MSIYSKDGDLLIRAYSKDGDLLSRAYDKDGTVVFTQGDSRTHPTPTEVETYFRDATLQAAEMIDAQSNDWVSFVWITDPHGSANEHHSQAIALYLLKNTKAEILVLGGDYSANSWSKTEYDTWMAPLLESEFVDQIYCVYGNHETYGNATQSREAIYGDYVEDKTELVGNLEQLYYYWDDTTRKIRYMILNTSDSSATTMSSTQIAWIQQNVTLPASDWSLVVFAHVNIESFGVTTMNESNSSAIVSAIAGCNGNIVGYFCGHQHIDAISRTSGGFYQATLYCDRFENTNYYTGYSITNREKGTLTEQAVSVISINTKTKRVVIRRIGVGNSDTLSFEYGS